MSAVAAPYLRLGDVAPDFCADSTEGEIDFHEWLGSSWGVLFSHPADFTPVCTTELSTVNTYFEEFEKRNCKVIAYSCDTKEQHDKWVPDILELCDGCYKLNYPILDGADRSVAVAYGMIDPANIDKEGLPLTVRSVFIINPNKVIKLILTYPASTGRNFDELVRVLDSLQLTAHEQLATPANWNKGDKAVIAPSVSDEAAEKKYGQFEKKFDYLRFTDWQKPSETN